MDPICFGLDKSNLLINSPENDLDSPKRFGPDQNNLDGPNLFVYQSFWTGPICFGQVQIIKK
jgi:hypothetical protein